MDKSRIPAIHPVKFWTDYEPNPAKPGEQIAVDWVSWVKKGDASGAITQSKIVRLKPRKNRQGVEVSTVEWSVIEPAYEAWKASEEPPENGTPLIAWPGCNDTLCDALKKLNIRTVEDFVEAPDPAFSGLPVPNIRYLREQATAFLIAQGEVSAVAGELAKRDAEIDDLKGVIETFKTEINALKSDNDKTGSGKAQASKPKGQQANAA